MNSIINIKKLAVVTTAALILGVSSSLAQAADINPFGMADVHPVYLAAKSGGKCGEGKCGGNKSKASENKSTDGKCGGKEKAKEGKCGGNKPKESKSKCGG